MIDIPCRNKNCHCGSRTDSGDCLNEVPCNATVYVKISYGIKTRF